MQELFSKIARSHLFQLLILSALIVDAGLLVLNFFFQIDLFYSAACKIIYRVILSLFITDALIRLGSHGRSPFNYFKDIWNLIDLAILSLLLIFPTYNCIAFLRLGRLFKQFRLLRKFETVLPSSELLTVGSVSLAAKFNVFKSLTLVKTSSQSWRSATALRKSRDLLGAIFDGAPIFLILCDVNGRIKLANQHCKRILGWGGMSSGNVYEMAQCFPSMSGYEKFLDRFNSPGSEWLDLQTKTREDRVLDTTWKSIQLPGGQLLLLGQDITDRKQIERALFEEKELAQITLKSIGDAVVTVNERGLIKTLNPVAEELTGWTEAEARGQPFAKVVHLVDGFTEVSSIDWLSHRSKSKERTVVAQPSLLRSRDGTEFTIDSSMAPICDRNGEIVGSVIVFRDTTESHQLTQALSWQATHDSLTNLLNRKAFENHVAEAVLRARQETLKSVLCYIDLDQFKVINDTCGHLAGDELLRQLATHLQQRVRSTDVLARLGGDEFGLLFDNCSLEQAEAVAESLRQLVNSHRFTWQGKTFTVGISMGLVAIDETTPNLPSIMSAADAACYAAKARGRNCIHIYQLDDLQLADQRGERQWIARLNHALEDERFCLYLQEISPLRQEQEKMLAEVLLRLIDEQGNLVSPGAFLPGAERYGLMPAIDRWVVEQFFSYCDRADTTEIATNNILYTINLSGASLNSDRFCQFLHERLTQYPLLAPFICFEITETVAIANLSRVVSVIEDLKQLGCSFALDDFGSGMSSLVYLKTLPVDYLKIDGSFVRNITKNRIDRAMVESCSRIAHVMDLKTIAEFVEDEAAIEDLRSLGVDYAQGFAVAKPHQFSFSLVGESSAMQANDRWIGRGESDRSPPKQSARH